MSAEAKPEGRIVATPNQLRVHNGLKCIAAGVPTLIEKPVADDVSEATKLVEAAEAAGVALLTGHHRCHNLLTRQAQEAIDSGRLGQVVAVHGICWFYKPEDYFEIEWWRKKGAGPIFLNLIHDSTTCASCTGTSPQCRRRRRTHCAATRSKTRP